MKIFICLLVVFCFLFLTSIFKVNLKYLEKNSSLSDLKFKANAGLYLFGFIKLFGINFSENGIKFLFLKIPYKKIIIDKNNIEFVKKFIAKENFKYLKPQIEKMNLELNIGVEDVRFTVFSVFVISTFLSLLSAKYRTQINMRNYNYEIIPNYNVNASNFKFSFKISEKTVNLIRTFILLNKVEKKKRYMRKILIENLYKFN